MQVEAVLCSADLSVSFRHRAHGMLAERLMHDTAHLAGNNSGVSKLSQRLSYYREMRGSVLLTIGESVMANLDHVYSNSQSHYSLDFIEFQSCATLNRCLRIPYDISS